MTVVEMPQLDAEYMSSEDFLERMENFNYKLVDLTLEDTSGESGWVNDYNTMVFRIDGMPFLLAMEFAEALVKMRPDECDSLEIGGAIYFRLWWD